MRVCGCMYSTAGQLEAKSINEDMIQKLISQFLNTMQLFEGRIRKKSQSMK